MERKSVGWVFKHMVLCSRKVFSSIIPNFDMLKNIQHVSWKNLIELKIVRSKIYSLESLTFIDMPQLDDIMLGNNFLIQRNCLFRNSKVPGKVLFPSTSVY